MSKCQNVVQTVAMLILIQVTKEIGTALNIILIIIVTTTADILNLNKPKMCVRRIK